MKVKEITCRLRWLASINLNKRSRWTGVSGPAPWFVFDVMKISRFLSLYPRLLRTTTASAFFGLIRTNLAVDPMTCLLFMGSPMWCRAGDNQRRATVGLNFFPTLVEGFTAGTGN